MWRWGGLTVQPEKCKYCGKYYVPAEEQERIIKLGIIPTNPKIKYPATDYWAGLGWGHII